MNKSSSSCSFSSEGHMMYLLIYFVWSPASCISFLFWSKVFLDVSLVWDRHVTLTFVSRALHCKFSGTAVLKFLFLEPVIQWPIPCADRVFRTHYNNCGPVFEPDVFEMHVWSIMARPCYMLWWKICNRPCLVVDVVYAKHCQPIFLLPRVLVGYWIVENVW